MLGAETLQDIGEKAWIPAFAGMTLHRTFKASLSFPRRRESIPSCFKAQGFNPDS
jgi:hypothetical protein